MRQCQQNPISQCLSNQKKKSQILYLIRHIQQDTSISIPIILLLLTQIRLCLSKIITQSLILHRQYILLSTPIIQFQLREISQLLQKMIIQALIPKLMMNNHQEVSLPHQIIHFQSNQISKYQILILRIKEKYQIEIFQSTLIILILSNPISQYLIKLKSQTQLHNLILMERIQQ